MGVDSLGQSEHSQNVTSESTLHILQIDILNLLAHDLLRSVVDQDIQSAIGFDMFIYHLFDLGSIHEVQCKVQTFPSVLLDCLFDILSTIRSAFKQNDTGEVRNVRGVSEDERTYSSSSSGR